MKRFALWGSIALAALSSAQLAPVQLYNGVKRPLSVVVKEPALAGKLEIDLYEAGADKPTATAPAKDGIADLAKLFPDLWTRKPTTLYAQLRVGDRSVGAPLVLVPLVSAPVATLAEDKRGVKFSPDEDQAFSGYRVYVDKHATLETTLGTIEVRLRPDAAPNTVWNFMQLVQGGFYNDVIWHRVVAKRPDGSPFVIQTGDPSGTGSGGPGYSIDLENSATLTYDFGVLGMARSTDPNTNGSQIFVALSREGTKHLDGRYTTFAQAVRGSDVILKIAAVPVGEQDRPKDPPRIIRARLRDAPPYGTAPKPVTRPAPKPNA